jgi:hypothetical protein
MRSIEAPESAARRRARMVSPPTNRVAPNDAWQWADDDI